MNVRQLIKVLKNYDQDAPVWHFSDQEGNRISEVLIADIQPEGALAFLPGNELELPE